MFQRSESVQRTAQPAPFRHPHWESPRARHARMFKREVREFLRQAEEQRARLAHARVLECVH